VFELRDQRRVAVEADSEMRCARQDLEFRSVRFRTHSRPSRPVHRGAEEDKPPVFKDQKDPSASKNGIDESGAKTRLCAARTKAWNQQTRGDREST
jgi:hypothetical protein